MDTLQQSKARLELANQTLKQQHQKELEARDEEMEQLKSSMTKKVCMGMFQIHLASINYMRLVKHLRVSCINASTCPSVITTMPLALCIS